MIRIFDSMQTQRPSLLLNYKNFPTDWQGSWRHVRFTINHVSCGCAAAVGSWIMWVSLDLSQSHHFFFCRTTSWFITKPSSFNRCEVWTVDAASLCDCAARSTSDHQLPGLLFSQQLLHSLDQTACRKRTGVDWNEIYRIHIL